MQDNSQISPEAISNVDVNVKSKTVAELEALLEFYASNGVDCAIDDTPHNRFAEMETARKERMNRMAEANTSSTPSPITASTSTPRQPPRQAPNQAPRPAPSANQAVPDATALQSARDFAVNAETLEALEAALMAFDGCNLKRTAKNLVFADGNPKARIMFVGEAPGRDEDIQGIPFIGRSGELLNKMLEAIGLTRENDAYIANVVPWRPPGNRTPTPQETELCRPFIERQIALVNPQILVPLGGAAAKQLFQTTEGIMKLRGKFRSYQLPTGEIEAMATLHPAYLLRQPGQKRLVWQDLLKIHSRLTANLDEG